jgi:hypothetical protein
VERPTAQATLVVSGPAERFANGNKVACYLGLIPTRMPTLLQPSEQIKESVFRSLPIEAAERACLYIPELKRDY